MKKPKKSDSNANKLQPLAAEKLAKVVGGIESSYVVFSPIVDVLPV